MILDFMNNSSPPITDGVTVYKINAKTHQRIVVGYLALNGVLRLNNPDKSLLDINRKKINVYYPTFTVYSLGNSKNINSPIKQLLLTDTDNSIGYFDNDSLVFWSQYE